MMDASEDRLAHLYLADLTVQFGKLKDLAERAIARVSDQQLKATLDADGNSIAVLIQHMAGNLRSRWTDFLTTDGEKPDRDRDAEFEVSAGVGRAHLLGLWEEGWSQLFGALAELTPADLQRTVQVRAEPHSVPQAIHRQLTHHAYHVGQLVLLARHFAAGSWESLSVPRGKSRERNAEMFGRSRR